MLFFAIVYVVEGIGQARVGIIFQPLNFYLKDIGWNTGRGHRVSRRPQFPVDHQAGLRLVSDLIPLFATVGRAT